MAAQKLANWPTQQRCFPVAAFRTKRSRVAGLSACRLVASDSHHPRARCAARCGERSCLVFSRVGFVSSFLSILIFCMQESELRKACWALIKSHPELAKTRLKRKHVNICVSASKNLGEILLSPFSLLNRFWQGPPGCPSLASHFFTCF